MNLIDGSTFCKFDQFVQLMDTDQVDPRSGFFAVVPVSAVKPGQVVIWNDSVVPADGILTWDDIPDPLIYFIIVSISPRSIFLRKLYDKIVIGTADPLQGQRPALEQFFLPTLSNPRLVVLSTFGASTFLPSPLPVTAIANLRLNFPDEVAHLPAVQHSDATAQALGIKSALRKETATFFSNIVRSATRRSTLLGVSSDVVTGVQQAFGAFQLDHDADHVLSNILQCSTEKNFGLLLTGEWITRPPCTYVSGKASESLIPGCSIFAYKLTTPGSPFPSFATCNELVLALRRLQAILIWLDIGLTSPTNNVSSWKTVDVFGTMIDQLENVSQMSLSNLSIDVTVSAVCKALKNGFIYLKTTDLTSLPLDAMLLEFKTRVIINVPELIQLYGIRAIAPSQGITVKADTLKRSASDMVAPTLPPSTSNTIKTGSTGTSYCLSVIHTFVGLGSTPCPLPCKASAIRNPASCHLNHIIPSRSANRHAKKTFLNNCQTSVNKATNMAPAYRKEITDKIALELSKL